MNKGVTYLALGDSYTIGEGVALFESFPYQIVQWLRSRDKPVHAPEIIAKTGWTTSELASQLDHTILNEHYTFVTLLIGVNNQYRGAPIDVYRTEFEELLQRSISLTGNVSGNVFVLSIPEWGRTPFASGRDISLISREIAAYNKVNFDFTQKYGASYVDITSDSPASIDDRSFLAADGLHPSPKEYRRWATMVAEKMLTSGTGL